MAFPIYTKSGRQMDYAIFERKMETYIKNGIDGWDHDLLELIGAQFKMIRDLNDRIESLELSIDTHEKRSTELEK